MIIIEVEGRFGNQMFQYAFGKMLSDKFSTILLIDEPHYHFQLHYFFEIKYLSWANRILRMIVRIFFPLKRMQFESEDSPKYNLEKLRNNIKYAGYFQSDEYFKFAEDQVRECFKWKSRYLKDFERFIKSESLKDSIIIHVRGTDYLDQGLKLEVDYYNMALSTMEVRANTKLAVVTDDAEYARRLFEGYDIAHFYSETMPVDFQIMQNANQLIISNSTFAWWAAYLNENKSAKIVAPKYWFGRSSNQEYPVGIMTNRFTWV
jgi:hypothetical protein